MNNISRFLNVLFCWALVLAADVWSTDYHVDPLAGSMTFSGNATNPWSTLEAVFNNGMRFTAGDRILLRRGYHGAPVITGNNSGMVTIMATPGHAPVMKSVKFSGAKLWTLQDIFINPQVVALDGEQYLIEFRNNSNNNSLRNILACSTQDPYGWRANEALWKANAKVGLQIQSGGGGTNIFERIYILNVFNGIDSPSTNNLYQYNVIENFTQDGIRPTGNFQTFQYNMVLNAIMDDHTLDGNLKPTPRRHRDLWQTLGTQTKQGIKAIGNIFITAADPSLPVAGYAPTSTGYVANESPVIAGWDGPFKDCQFINNVIFTDHPTGIWLNGASNCIVNNNTMSRIRSNSSRLQPIIKIGSKTATSTPSTNNIAYNNIAEGIILTNGGDAGGGSSSVLAPGGSGNNIVVNRSSFANTFLAQAMPYADVRLKSSATNAIGLANPNQAPAKDADGNDRPANGKADIGAYEYGYLTNNDTEPPSKPGQPRVILVTRLGSDLEWTASTDNRNVIAGYDIYRNGVKVGRTRVGTRFFDLHNVTGPLSYTIKAFDHSGNMSPFSDPGVPGATPTNYTLTVLSGSGSGNYTSGTVVNVTANAAPNNKLFDKWTGSTSGMANINLANTTITMPAANISISATYKDAPLPSYALSVASGSGDGSYLAGAIVNILADAPVAGKTFDKWTGSISGISNIMSANTSITMPSANTSISATYKDILYSLTVTSGSGTGNYAFNALVPVMANAPAANKIFDKWTGNTAGLANILAASTNLIMPSANTAISATYKDVLFALVVNSGAGDGNYPVGNIINIRADIAPLGKVFDKWTGDTLGVANISAPSTTITMSSVNATITATYKDILYSLSVTSGSGSGNYALNTVVPVLAHSPPANKVFDKWTGNTTGLANILAASTNLIMPSANTAITATYKDVLFALVVNSGSGDGNYPSGNIINITADAATPGKTFDKWTGNTVGIANISSPSTTITMPSANATIMATYKDILYTLVVNSGTGDGSYPSGNVIIINADSAPLGKVFDKWTGNTVGIANINASSTTITMPSANATITATYKDILYTLAVTSGTGSGNYALNTLVPVVANAPANNKVFDKWTGNTAGMANILAASTNLIMPSANTAILATYKDVLYSLVINSGNGDGNYLAGTVISITADAPATGKSFDQWTGNVAGITNVLSATTNLTMPSANAVISATYKDNFYTLAVNAGSGDGSYKLGAVVYINADAPASGKMFDKWTGDTAVVANINSAATTLVMPAGNVTVSATYKDIPPQSFSLTVNSGSGDGSYLGGTVVGIVADAAPTGKIFDKWTGDISGIANVLTASTTLTMPSASTIVTASYKDIVYSLFVNSGSGDGSYTPATVVSIIADAPVIGKSFDKWIGQTTGINNISSANTTIAMPSANTTITATYKETLYGLSVISGIGSGNYKLGDLVAISANVAPTGKIFDSWSGNVSSVANTLAPSTNLLMPATNISIIANFRDILYELNVASGSGDGSYKTGSVVAISADTPASGKRFDKWTGNTSGIASINSASTTLVMPSANASITATYIDIPVVNFSLTVNNGTGSGSYPARQAINISADPAPLGKVFERWTGDTLILAIVTSPSTIVTMPSVAVQVTAVYRNLIYQLQVGQGSGSGSYDMGATVVIQAQSAGHGKVFSRWIGDVASVANPALPLTTLSMPAGNIAIEASFAYIKDHDHDLDGMDNAWELAHGMDPENPADQAADKDLDGLTNAFEFNIGTDPTKKDSDGDGVNDKVEQANGKSPTVPENPVMFEARLLDSPVLGRRVHFKAQAGHPGGLALRSMSWTFARRPVGSAEIVVTDLGYAELDLPVAGNYQIKVSAVDELGHASEELSMSFTVINPTNLPPLADAGADGQGLVGQKINLYGGNSRDPEDGQPAQYLWTLRIKPDSSKASIENATAELASFLPDVAGRYMFQLSVRDSQNLESASSNSPNHALFENPGDEVVFWNILNPQGANPPTIRLANAFVIGKTGEPFSMDASKSSDIDGHALSFRWQVLTRPRGSASELSNADKSSAQCTPDLPGRYLVHLKLSDSSGMSSEALVNIFVDADANHHPRVNAGALQRHMLGDADLTVQLNGSVTDEDGDLQSSSWLQIEGAPVLLANPSSASTSFTISRSMARREGVYRFMLEAVDKKGLGGYGIATIIIESASDRLPSVSTFRFPALKVETNISRIVLGAESRIIAQVDARGDSGETLTVFWTQIKGPSVFFRLESESTNDNIHNEVLILKPSVSGEYAFRVYVDDGKPRSVDMEVVFQADASAQAAEAVTTLPRVDTAVPLVTNPVDINTTSLGTNANGSTASGGGGGGCLLH